MVKLDFHGKEDRRWTGPRLRASAIIGHTTTTSAKIWVRCRYEGKFHLILCQAELTGDELEIADKEAEGYVAELGSKVVYHKSHNFRDQDDRTHVFEISGLSDGTRYHYYLFSKDTSADDRMIIGRQTRYSFKTISKDRNSLVFGLYSCHDPFKENSGTLPWKHFFSVLKEQNADFVVGGGDQVYVDTTETDIWKWLKKIKSDLLKETKPQILEKMLSWYQDVYRGYWGFPYIRRVLRSFPNYMIWDDHEIMDGWGSRSRDELSDELDTWYEWENKKKNLMLADTMFEAAKIVYDQYQHSHNPKTAAGVFDFSLAQKHSEFYFLDMRGQREFDLARLKKRDGKNATDRILGKQQLARLKAWLKNISKETKIVYIVSPVPVVHWTGFAVNTGDVLGAKDDFRDEWDHETNHAERDKMLNAVFSLSHEFGEFGVPIAFLSGDVHMSAVFRLTNRKFRKAKIFQITSSPITRPPAPGIADIILSNEGALKTGKKDSGYRYRRLAKFHTRNFCILKSDTLKEGGLSLYVDFYGESNDQEEIRRKRIKLL